MRNKAFILVLASSLFVLLYYFWPKTKYLDPNENQAPTISHTEKTKAPLIKQDSQFTPVKKEKSGEQGKEKRAIENYQAILDEDPVVDASLLLRQNRMCYNYLAKNYTESKRKEFFKRFERNLDEKQKKYHQSYLSYCKKLDKQHPEYHLTEQQTIQEQLNQSNATGLWGKILSNEVTVDSLSEYEISDLLKQNNLSILSLAPKKLETYYNKVIHWDMEAVLQNHQYDYVKLVTSYAHQLYLCQIGDDCSAQSSIMSMRCYLSSQSCGLNYPEYISQVLTAGQQADIQIALQYLQSKYQ